MDGSLPFGLRSAPKVFTAVADALEWVMRRRGVTWVAHYLITMGPPASEVCGSKLEERVRAVCNDIGVPLAVDKIEGPVPCLTFLGIELDMQAGVMRLPADRLFRLRDSLVRWATRKTCCRRELESLVGTLQHACRVVKPGRAFLRRMIDLLSATKDHHHIRLNRQFRADLHWWRTGTGYPCSPAALNLHARSRPTPPARGGAGPGRDQAGSSSSGPRQRRIACAVWGKLWRVEWRCDNQAAVHAVTSRSCRDQTMMHLVRCIFFLEAWCGFKVTATYLPGEENTLTDDLSLNRLPLFLSKARSPDCTPTGIQPALPELLLGHADWTSPHFGSSLS